MYRIDFTPLKDLLRRFTEKGPSGCAMIVSRKGETVFSHYEGVSDLNSGRPMQEDTIFQLHSNSKLIAVVAAMQLYEQGLLSLNDPVEMYLPEFKGRQVISYAGNNMFTEKPARNKVRIKHLMKMTDGSAGWISEGEVTPAHAAVREIYRRVKDRNDVSLREFSRLSSQIPLLFEPGTSFNYGIGINVVAAVVEELAGMEFEEYLKENVFRPLGMVDTGFCVPADWMERAAKMYTLGEDGELTQNVDQDWRFAPGGVFKNASGGLVSTVADMDKFAKMLVQGGALDGVRILGRKTVDLIRQNHLQGEALEAFQRTHENGWGFLAGYGFGLGCRVLLDRTQAGCNGTEGEYGWFGAAGMWQLIDPVEELCATYAHMLMPNNLVDSCHPQLRAVLYGCL